MKNSLKRIENSHVSNYNVIALFLCLLSDFCYLAFPVLNIEALSDGMILNTDVFSLMWSMPYTAIPIVFPLAVLLLRLIIPKRWMIRSLLQVIIGIAGVAVLFRISDMVLPWAMTDSAAGYYGAFMITAIFLFDIDNAASKLEVPEDDEDDEDEEGEEADYSFPDDDE